MPTEPKPPKPESTVLDLATPEDAAQLASLHGEVARKLTAEFGRGHWSHVPSERGVLRDMKEATILVHRRAGEVIATLTLATRKPWAIDTAYFTPSKRALYLRNMAVAPTLQRQGVGRDCVRSAVEWARQRPADVIRLDAYGAAAGAGEFYRKCGFAETGRVIYRAVALIYFEFLTSPQNDSAAKA